MGAVAKPLAEHHQLHGVQPVLPVPDVRSAAEWFVRVLGFTIDFLHGDAPGGHRLVLGAEINHAPLSVDV